MRPKALGKVGTERRREASVNGWLEGHVISFLYRHFVFVSSAVLGAFWLWNTGVCMVIRSGSYTRCGYGVLGAVTSTIVRKIRHGICSAGSETANSLYC